jgi:chemotaxis protein CheD
MATLAPVKVSVGIGQLAVTRDPNDVLVAYGLGSCIGIAVFDPDARLAAMAHVLLPLADGKPFEAKEPARYADRAIPALLEALKAAGSRGGRLVVKVAGGASVLGKANAEKFKIVERNAEAVKEQLRRCGLRVAAADLGGEKGRTLELHAASGTVYVRTAASPACEL